MFLPNNNINLIQVATTPEVVDMNRLTPQYNHHQQINSTLDVSSNNNNNTIVQPIQEESQSIQQMISNFKLRPLRAYQQEQETLQNRPVSNSLPQHSNSSRSIIGSNSLQNVQQNTIVNSISTVIIPSSTNHQTQIVSNNSSTNNQANENPLQLIYSEVHAQQQNEAESQGLLLGSFDISSDSDNGKNGHSNIKTYLRVALLVFHIICQIVMSGMIGISFILYDWKTMIIFTPKILLGFLVVLAVYKKKNGFLHFLLGSILLDLIYTTTLVGLRFYVTARPGQVTILEESNTSNLSIINNHVAAHSIVYTPEWTHSSVEWIKEVTEPIPFSESSPNEHRDMQGTSAASEAQRKKLPGLWFQFGIQIMGGFIVLLTIIWTLMNQQ